MGLLETLEEKINKNNFEEIAKNLNKIHNSYLIDCEAWKTVSNILGDEYRFILNSYKDKVSAFNIINDIIMKYCVGERVVKYHLIKEHLSKKDTITLFEMNVDNSRIDVCSINGKSVAYEIKTEFDTVTRLEKQVSDYLKVFEYVYIICDTSHIDKVKPIVPECCGIKTYKITNGTCKFLTKRRATKNHNIDYIAQVRNLSSEDIRGILKEIGIKDIPSSRKDREKIFLEKCDERKINNMFKFAIKKRYKKQWNFLTENFSNILPIDIQSFFHSPIDPELVYSKSMFLDSLEL